MRLFVTGSQEPEFIEDTLDQLHGDFCITSICGSALSPCMNTVTEWCEDSLVQLNLYLPEGYTELDAINTNKLALIKDKPQFVLVYDETDKMNKMIAEVASNSNSIEFVARKE